MTRASDTARLLGAGATILDGTTISTADNTNQLTLISTDADASTGPNLVLQRDSASPADNDLAGTVKFIADNDAGEATDCVSMFSKIIDASDGTEDASLLVNSIVGGSQISRFGITPTEIVLNDDSIDLDFRVESNGNANMIFVEGSTDRVGIGTSSPASSLAVLGSSTSGSGIVDTLTLKNTGTTGDDGAKIQFTAGTSTSGAGIGSGGQAVNSADLRFFSGGNTERMRFFSDGTLSVGSSSSTGGDQVKFHNTGSGFILNLNNASASSKMIITAQSGTGLVTHHQFNNSNGEVGTIKTQNSATNYNTSSDYRLKENVSYDFDATTRLKQLKPARFNFISDETNTLIDGFIAHEVSSIVPQAVMGEKDATETYTDDDGNEQTRISPQSIDHSKIVPLLVKTIQELEARITTLENA